LKFSLIFWFLGYKIGFLLKVILYSDYNCHNFQGPKFVKILAIIYKLCKKPAKFYPNVKYIFDKQFYFYQLYKNTYNNRNKKMIQYDSFSPSKKTRRNIFQNTNKDDY
jgi:hypothetical protein